MSRPDSGKKPQLNKIVKLTLVGQDGSVLDGEMLCSIPAPRYSSGGPEFQFSESSLRFTALPLMEAASWWPGALVVAV